MALSDRIRMIIRESGLKQKEFAKSINVTDSYISKLVRDETGISNSTAMLIEQLYGYSKDWILCGEGQKMIRSGGLSVLQNEIIANVEQMNRDELQILLAFIESIKKLKHKQKSDKHENG